MVDSSHQDPDEPDRPATYGVYDALFGGANNFAADRQVAQDVVAVVPGAPEAVWLNRAFLHRAVEWLAEHGIDQFLDIGAGGPGPDPVHHVANRVNPATRVVYVDTNRVVSAYLADAFGDHSRVGVITGDLRDPEAILTNPTVHRVLDLSRPVGIVLGAVLHFLPDSDHPARVLAAYRDRIAPGSYLVATHVSGDYQPDRVAEAIKPYARTGDPIFPRSREEFTGLLTDAGFVPVEPGVVWTPQWHPNGPDERPPERGYCYACVAR